MIRGSALLLLAPLPVAGCGIENTFLPPHQSDVFYQAPSDEVDILFVVDDSASMGEEQQALSDGFRTFLGELEGSATKYRIGLVSTSQDSDDPDRTDLVGDPPILTPATDTVHLFQRRVLLGTRGSDHEKGLQAAADTLHAHPEFLRNDANLVVVFVTDEDDCSDGGALDGLDADECYLETDRLTPVSELVDRIRRTKHRGEAVRLGGIVGPLDKSCPDAWSSERYARAIASTGGPMGKICAPDWTPTLRDLGAEAVGLVDRWVLTFVPDQSTIQVFVDDQPSYLDPENGWTFEAETNELAFHGDGVPERNAEVRVEYEVGGSRTP